MQWITAAFLIVTAYILGSIPFGLHLGRLRGVDIRTVGSRNIGATNLARAVGRRWGVAAFCLDFLKGALPVAACRWLESASTLLPDSALTTDGWLAAACGLSAVLGHIFSVFLSFRGGKGVATAFGVVTALMWQAALVAGAGWLLVYLATRTVSLASLIAAILLPSAVSIFHVYLSPLAGYAAIQTITLAGAVLIIVRHHSNIVRLINGEEFEFRRRGEE